MLTKQQIVCFSTEDWDTPLPTNKHQLMVRLAKANNEIIYVETIGIRKPSIRKADMKRIKQRIQKSLSQPKAGTKNLTVVSPLVIPGQGKGRIGRPISVGLEPRALQHEVGPVYPWYLPGSCCTVDSSGDHFPQFLGDQDSSSQYWMPWCTKKI